MLLVILSLVGLFPGLGIADFGGHDLFTSLAQLNELWKNELLVVNQIKETLKQIDVVKKHLETYVDNHHKLGLHNQPNYDFLGHPINAYHLIRHIASGWTTIRNETFNVSKENSIGKNLMSQLAVLQKREIDNKLPDFEDIRGGAFGIVRLISLYKINLTDLVDHGKVVTTLDNGKYVESGSSVLKLNSFDLKEMALAASDNSYHDACTDIFSQACRIAEYEINAGIKDFPFLNYVPNLSIIKKLTETAQKVHDHTLDNRGMKSNVHRTHQKPFDVKLRKKKKFKKAFKLQKRISTREELEIMENLMNGDDSKYAEFNLITEVQVDELCRGMQLRTAEQTKNLKCVYAHGNSKWLRLGPIKMEINSHDPYHVTLREILYENECDEITEFLGPKLDFPPGRMRTKSAKNDWTMKNCWPNESDNDKLDKLNRRIEHLSGLFAATNKNYSEPFMCGNYGIGGHYWTHPDYHHESPSLYRAGSTGNRVATVMTILESPIAGGATVWPYAGFSVFPEKGSAAFWFNTRSSGFTDSYTRHAACPVLLGQKWIGNKWIGYNAQWDERKCDIDPFSLFQGPYS